MSGFDIQNRFVPEFLKNLSNMSAMQNVEADNLFYLYTCLIFAYKMNVVPWHDFTKLFLSNNRGRYDVFYPLSLNNKRPVTFINSSWKCLILKSSIHVLIIPNHSIPIHLHNWQQSLCCHGKLHWFPGQWLVSRCWK